MRDRHGIQAVCRTPELMAEATLQPLARFDLDAALLFFEVSLVLEPLGLAVVGGDDGELRLESCLRSAEAIASLRQYEPRQELAFLQEAIGIVRQRLGSHRPLLGLSAGPFTLACYAVEGLRPDVSRVKSFMFTEPAAWHQLCSLLADVATDCLLAQIEAGVHAVQVYDTWIGALSAEDYGQYVLPHSRDLFERIRATGVPSIHFGLGTAHLLQSMAEAGGDVIGVDWRVGLDEAWSRIGAGRAIQGNLNPTLLVGPLDGLLEGLEDVLARAGDRPGHIFNLGHGLLPSTPLDRVDTLTRYVHAWNGRHMR